MRKTIRRAVSWISLREAKERDGDSNVGGIWRKKSCGSGFGGDTEQTPARTRAVQEEKTAWTYAWRLEKSVPAPEQSITRRRGKPVCVCVW